MPHDRRSGGNFKSHFLASTSVAVADGLPSGSGTKLPPDAQAAVADVRGVVSDVRARWPAWRDQISDVVARVDGESRRLEGLGQAVSDGVKEVRAVVARGQEIVDEMMYRIAALMPAVSMSLKGYIFPSRPLNSNGSSTESRVVPGTSLTMSRSL